VRGLSSPIQLKGGEGFMKEILKNNEKELYVACEDVTRDDSVVVKDMLEVFSRSLIPGHDSSYCIGVGLAANQIGHSKRVILISPAAKADEITVMNNPVIVNHGKDVVQEEEACLSYPGVKSIVGRYRVIDVEYYDMSWNKIKETYKGFAARIIQHEIDHLNGLNCLQNRL
jgi:peptide deformylase